VPETGRRTKADPTPPVSEVPRAGEAEAAERPICTVAFCPICMAVTAAQVAAPDAIDHLLAAAREFLMAARAVVDARADDVAGVEVAPEKRLERIEIA
jgi:hypothetical protein